MSLIEEVQKEGMFTNDSLFSNNKIKLINRCDDKCQRVI